MPDFHGPNAAYVIELYERYREAPDSVDEHTRAFFANWSPNVIENGKVSINAAVATVEDVSTAAEIQKAGAAVALAQAIRQLGHLDADLDPLNSARPGDPELNPEFHGITDEDLRHLPASIIGGPIARKAANAYEAIQELRDVYCSTIGYDNDHIRIPEERNWLREVAESRRFRFTESKESNLQVLEELTRIEAFEQFLQRSFPTKYRFSIEGLDSMVSILEEIVRQSRETNTTTIALAMAHRGRLNVLTHIMGKPYAQVLSEFRDELLSEDVGIQQGDVKYHLAFRRMIGYNAKGKELIITMPPNPSHLEAVNPVAVGMARAAGTPADHGGEPTFNHELTMQILIHGDAAFPGQGIVSETFNLSLLPGYWTGGTIHIIANNQVGFTTLPVDGRSTLYASDLAKGFKVPIIHVNADDPAACIEVARIAVAYHETFDKDILIDLVGYRRYGHNELDEPGFTQPLMYDVVRNHETVRKLWTKHMVSLGQITEDEAEALLSEHLDQLQSIYDNLPPAEDLDDRPSVDAPPLAAEKVDTTVDMKTLRAINDSLADIPEDFHFYSVRFKKTIESRREVFNDPTAKVVDWATAEELAFAAILADGTAIRITGQDVERGTFSHRHAVLNDAETGKKHVPLQALKQAEASFEIHNSPLSEAAALGFEYGYNVQQPDRLVLWEAQYGDFNNNAQVIIDEFIVSAREKWRQTPSLVLLLPHGHEGAGPDHSSARLERYLQMAAKMNIRIANCTTAAQYFHLLRRQAKLLTIDPLPLVIMSPKSLLRNPRVASSVEELANGRFQPVIDDENADPEKVTRLLLCSGKIYYDLADSDHYKEHPEIAVVRIEQLYPFPAKYLEPVIERYPNLKEVIWTQEEPKNMGAWDFMGWRLRKLVRGRGKNILVEYVGRRRSATPAEGSKNAHFKNQSILIDAAFNHKFNGAKSS